MKKPISTNSEQMKNANMPLDQKFVSGTRKIPFINNKQIVISDASVNKDLDVNDMLQDGKIFQSNAPLSQFNIKKNQLQEKTNIFKIKYFQTQINILHKNDHFPMKISSLETSNPICIQNEHMFNLESLMDQSEDTDLILARRESGKRRILEIDPTISHYYKIKCKGYDKAISDYSQSKYFALFIVYVNLNEEIITTLATCNIQQIDHLLKKFIDKKYTNQKIIQSLSDFHQSKDSS